MHHGASSKCENENIGDSIEPRWTTCCGRLAMILSAGCLRRVQEDKRKIYDYSDFYDQLSEYSFAFSTHTAREWGREREREISP